MLLKWLFIGCELVLSLICASIYITAFIRIALDARAGGGEVLYACEISGEILMVSSMVFRSIWEQAPTITLKDCPTGRLWAGFHRIGCFIYIVRLVAIT